MTEKEQRIRERLAKVKNLASRPGSSGEGQSAESAIKRLQKQLKSLKEKKKEESVLARIKFKSPAFADFFIDLCYLYKLDANYGKRTRKGINVRVFGIKSQIEVLVEITEILAPRYEAFCVEKYKFVREANKIYNKETEKYKQKLLKADFKDVSEIDPTVNEKVDKAFEDKEDEEAFEGWD